MVLSINKENTFISNNIIFLLFISSILLNYIYIDKLYYGLYIITFILMFIDVLQFNSKNIKVKYNKYISSLLFVFILYSIIISIIHYKTIGLIYIYKVINIFLVFFFCYFKLRTKSIQYMYRFYDYFIKIMNAIVIINFIEIITKHNIFYKFLRTNAQNAAKTIYLSSTVNFRAFSIFAHPIIYGIFLVCLYWCNNFLIKNKYIKISIQVIIIINLYFTQARSAYLAFIITVILYYIKLLVNQMHKQFKLRYTDIILFSFTSVLVIIGCVLIKNEIFNMYNQLYMKFITITNDSYNDPSRIQRLGMTKSIINYMLNNGIVNFLFGNGFGSISQFLKNIQILIVGYSTSDNQYMSYLYEFGFVGLSLYCLILICSVIHFFKVNNTNMRMLPIMCILTISISMIFIEANIWADLYMFLIINMFFLCVKTNETITS